MTPDNAVTRDKAHLETKAAPHTAAARWRQPLDAAQRRLLAWWMRHTRRERLLLGLAAALILLTLLWLALLRPAWQTLDAARTRLPQLRSDMARIQTMVREAQTLQQGRSANVSAAQVWLILPASLQRAALGGTVELANRPATAGAPTGAIPQRWELAVNGAPIVALLDWLASLPRMQVRVQTLTLTRTVVDGREQPGLVSGRIVLTQDATP